jgi:hypothetical protein
MSCVFPEAAALSGRYRSVRPIALLVTRAADVWPYRTPHAADLCEALRQAAEERRGGIEELLRVVADPSEKRLPELVCACLVALGRQLLSLKKQILEFDRMIPAWHRSNQTSKRLNCIPGVGPLLATALVASVGDPKSLLQKGSATRYEHAARHVRQIDSLNAQLENYADFETHDEFMARLLRAHPRKTGFWLLLRD